MTPELKEAKVGIIVISGSGEPLLHPHFNDIVTSLKSTGAKLKLLSNGSLLTPDKAKFLLEQELDELRISLWAKTPQEFMANYPDTKPEFFNKIIDNIKHMASLKKERNSKKPKLSIHHPINRNNLSNLHLLPSFAQELGLDEISFSALIPYPEVDQQSLLQKDDLPHFKSELNKLKKPFKELNIHSNIDQTIFQQEFGSEMVDCVGCYNGWFQLRIQEDGEASPCNTCNLFVGNAHNSTIMELWRGDKMQNFRERACTFNGLKQIASDGFCEYCSSYHVNRKIHRIVSRIPFTHAGR